MNKEIIVKTITNSHIGHMIHHNSVFSLDDQWIVFDSRNDETKIGETSTIGIVHVNTGEERLIYKTKNQTEYGPGVGAASFSPLQDRVIFIHGLYDADQEKPYDLTRRFGLAVDIAKPEYGIQMDARDILAPYTLGSLRGGTHSHCWSKDGLLISFTYNDAFVDSDLREVGVMLPSDNIIQVPKIKGNNDGEFYSVIVSDVVRNPTWGSDEISKAFDECWVTSNILSNKYVLAFQGNTLNVMGEVVTEIYTVDIDPKSIHQDPLTIGKEGEKPQVPKGVTQKRLSSTKNGLSDLRHWLRSSPDGQYIYALAKDVLGRNQIIQCEVTTGDFKYLSDFDFSVSSPININYLGDKIAFVANNNVYLYHLESTKLKQLTSFSSNDSKIVGAPVFSRKDDKIAFNQFALVDNVQYVQIKLISF